MHDDMMWYHVTLDFRLPECYQAISLEAISKMISYLLTMAA